MASFKARVASAPKLVLPITGGSCSEPANKKQKKEAQRSVISWPLGWDVLAQGLIELIV
jgi:hypothetical protein